MGLDPNYLYDNADVLWYGTEGYQNALSALKKVTGKSDEAVELMLNGQYGAADYWTAVQALKDKGVVTAYNTNGYRCFAYADDVVMTSPTGPITQIDSNATSTTLVKAAPAYDVVVDEVTSSPTYGKVLTNPVGKYLNPAHGFYGWRFFAGECLQAVNCASVGIFLGKTIDSALYNLNPDFWNANGMASLNPETWGSITNGDDSFAAGLFNTIFGIDPNTGNGQAFIDENAMAYMAYFMKTQGMFNPVDSSVIDNPNPSVFNDVNIPLYLGERSIGYGYQDGRYYRNLVLVDTTDPTAKTFMFLTPNVNERRRECVFASATGGTHNAIRYQYVDGELRQTSNLTWNFQLTYAYDDKVVYYYPIEELDYRTIAECFPMPSAPYADRKNIGQQAWLALYNATEAGSIEGIGNQDGATLPDVSNWNDIPSTLQALKDQYPSMWDNAVPNTIVQPDGSTQTINYIPVPMPNAKGQWDSQPTSGISSQANPQVQPQPNPTPENNDLLKLLLQLVTMPEPQPDPETQPQTQPQQPDVPNMPNTGTGDSPTPVAPSGSASALWSVYHPTQAQINSFGAWLWGSPFLTDIGKLFQNPIDGVISLHKIYATPIDSGSGTIVVGTLDSQVSSATVTQQYVTVNCGSVDCHEEFGTVFDYPPHTKVSLYLPFIGIVDLDTNDVMRSTITVTYGVDVFTGACLAMVEVTRDGSTVNLYQYAGVCAVSYPLGNVQQSQLFSGLLAIAGGVIAAAGSGGIGVPAALAMGGGIGAAAKTSIGRSGGFSGNAGAMGIKKPYLILQRPQTKVAETFPRLSGYPTNKSGKLSDFSGQVNVTSVHVEGINATDAELKEIEALLKSGVLV